MNSEQLRQIAEEGFCIIPDVLSLAEIRRLLLNLELVPKAVDSRRHGGTRNLLQYDSIRDLANSQKIKKLVSPVLGANAFPVRAILFDKVPESNWKVPWHQDLSIAVCERIDVKGFGPWSVKAGVLHVQPPASVLERMLAVRIHLDDCGDENGPLRVISGSHLCGRILENEIEEFTKDSTVECTVPAGGVLLMKPLLLHASAPSRSPEHRRVIHIEYASAGLPGGLRWHVDCAREQTTG